MKLTERQREALAEKPTVDAILSVMAGAIDEAGERVLSTSPDQLLTAHTKYLGMKELLVNVRRIVTSPKGT